MRADDRGYRYRAARWSAVVAVAVALAITTTVFRPGRAAVPETVTSPPTTPGADEPDRPGPYAVGRTTITVIDPARPARPARPLTVDVLYPVDPADAAGRTTSRYEITPGAGYPSRLALADPPASSAGPFPLVVYSHGRGGVRFQSAFLTEALAGHGYVVAAPDHPGDTMTDAAAGTSEDVVYLATDRTLDVETVITAMTRTNTRFAHLVDPARIGVVGFSFGGLTSVVSSVGFLSAPGDPRVTASVGLAPAISAVPADVLARVRVPTLLVGATGDMAAPVWTNADRAYAELGARPRYLVDITGAAHNSFTDVCELVRAADDPKVPRRLAMTLEITARGTCEPPVLPVADAHRVTVVYTVAFLQRYLRDDRRYDRYLTADYSRSIPQVRFSGTP